MKIEYWDMNKEGFITKTIIEKTGLIDKQVI
jgi:hypothetical protein